MGIVTDFLSRYHSAASNDKSSYYQSIEPTQRVIDLATRINQWHDTRPVPERWQPVQLGRLAAQFGVTRETAAAALEYAGWKETKSGATSLWTPPTNS